MRLSGVALLLAPWASAAGEAALNRGDLPARLSPAPEATEFWDLTARFDDGYRLFARFGITNEGPGERTAGAVWYLVHPDGRISEFRNGRAQGRWKLSPDHLRIDVASSSLDLHPPVRRVALDSNSQGAKINLQFPAGEIRVRSADPSTAKFGTATVQLAAPIDGTIWLRGMPTPVALRGTTALAHTWVNESIPDLVQRRIEFVADTADLAVYLSDITTPAGTHFRSLAVERGGASAYQTTDFELALGPAGPGIADRKYPLPDQLSIGDDGVTLAIRPERLLLRTNPLTLVPQPFRILFSFKVEPLWVWADASFHLKIDSAGDTVPIEAEGQGILTVSFLNPLPWPN